MSGVPSQKALSVVAPARDEQDNVRRLVEELEAVLEPAGIDYEILVVDDRSRDRTPRLLEELRSVRPRLRVLTRLDVEDQGGGQSAAFRAAFRACRGELIATLDADLQNDPAEIPRLVAMLHETGADIVQGDRSRDRRDTVVKRFSSWVGWTFRRMVLKDRVRDTGCSLRVLRRSVALELPLEFRGMHRFIPVTLKQLGHKVVETRVRHRPRAAGRSKYGVWNRALPGLIDLFAVRWMHARYRPGRFEERAGSRQDDSAEAE